MTASTPHSQPDSGQADNSHPDLYTCRTCRHWQFSLIEGRGWCRRDGTPKLIEAKSYMKHCWQARR